MEKNMNMPLAGVRVVELATVVAAPTTSRMLCAYGAEVVKVETLYGDEMRRAGKTELTPYEDYKNPLFTVHNSNKRLTSINFKDPEGKAALLKLIGEADVFITNVREASLRRSGLDYDTLRESFPQLIYAHFSGFGPKGPVASNPGFDSTGFWLRSGPMADWQVEGSFPFVPTYAFGDMATSSVLLSGILMALLGREKTGCGTKVETSLFASGIWCNSVGVVETQFERRHLNPDPFRPADPFDTTYKCADGKWIGVYVNEYKKDKAKLAKLLGMEDILEDPRYARGERRHSRGRQALQRDFPHAHQRRVARAPERQQRLLRGHAEHLRRQPRQPGHREPLCRGAGVRRWAQGHDALSARAFQRVHPPALRAYRRDRQGHRRRLRLARLQRRRDSAPEGEGRYPVIKTIKKEGTPNG